MITSSLRNCFSIASVVAALLLSAAPAAHANRYKIVDLGSNQQGILGRLNSHRVVVAGLTHAMRFHNGTWEQLPNDGLNAQAYDVNDFGAIAGYERVSTYVTNPVIWGPGNRKRSIPLPEGATTGTAHSISDTGLVAGRWEGPGDAVFRCFMFAPHLGSVDLGLIGNDDACWTSDIDIFGRVVGYSVNQRDGGAWHAFIWHDGILRDLGNLGGGWALAYAINASGHVVGVSTASDFNYHAFIWHQGRMTDLTEASGGTLGSAHDINLAGEIVGWGPSYFGETYAVRYDHGKTVMLSDEVEDLGDWKLDGAWFINDRGDITGIGSRSDGYHWFMLVRQRGAP